MPARTALAARDERSERQLGATIRQLRGHAGWTLARLAEEAGISAAAVFKIEKGTMVPSISVVLKLARALNRSVEELLSPAVESLAAVSKKSGRSEIKFSEIPIGVERLVGRLPDRQLECGIYHVDKGGVSTREVLSHKGEKLYYVLSGRIRFELDKKSVLLGEGDAIHLKASVPHRWENQFDGESRVLYVVTPPPLSRPDGETRAELEAEPAVAKKTVSKKRGRS